MANGGRWDFVGITISVWGREKRPESLAAVNERPVRFPDHVKERHSATHLSQKASGRSGDYVEMCGRVLSPCLMSIWEDSAM